MDTAAKDVAVEIRASGVDELREHGAELFEAHADECEPDRGEVKPNWLGYYELDARGLLIMLAAWTVHTQPEELVGYAVLFLLPSQHYVGQAIAHHDVLYVDPHHRKGLLGKRLIVEAERAAARAGATEIVMHAKPDSSLYQLLPMFGFKIEELVFRKEIESCPLP